MSGALEIAGLALAAFPLVISLLETYEQGYEGLRDWICFRREFTHLLNDLKREKILFDQQMEGLLRSVTDSDFDTSEMLLNLQSDEWKSPELTSRLRERLSGPGEFESYDSSLQSICRNLDRMATKLKSCEPPDRSADGAFQGGVFLQKKFHKLQFSLRKTKWQEQVIDLGRQIDRAGKLLGEAEALAPARQPRKTAIAQVFEQARNQASSLHKAITQSWTCDCKDHAFKLVLNRAKVSEVPNARCRAFKVSFPLRSRMWARLETILHEKDRWHTTETTMMPTSQQANNLTIREERTECSGSISAVSSSSLAPPSCISRTSSSDQAASLSTAATTALTMSSGVRERHVSFKKNETSRKESPSPLSLPEKASLISDLCRVLQNCGDEACLGYLEDGQGSCHVFHTSTAPVFRADELERIVSLKAILDPKLQNEAVRCELSRRDRLSIALTLSHALLELYTTPWLPKSWSTTDVYFFQRRNGEIMTESPFLLCKTEPNQKTILAKPHSGQDDFQDHAGALLSLGILIMELWFGESIENRSFWRRHCDGQGEERDLTRLMAAIEWQKQAKNEGGVALHDITHRCVRGNFGMTTINLGDDKCVGAVYEGVVKPLEGLLGYFWPE